METLENGGSENRDPESRGREKPEARGDLLLFLARAPQTSLLILSSLNLLTVTWDLKIIFLGLSCWLSGSSTYYLSMMVSV